MDHRDTAKDRALFSSVDKNRMLGVPNPNQYWFDSMRDDLLDDDFAELVQEIKYTDPEGDEDIILAVPIKFIVCSSCEGRGSYVNPNIDRDGITGEEWERDFDEEDREMYFRGGYDVTCEECRGEKVVAWPIDERVEKFIYDYWQGLAEMYAEQESERRMGA